MGIKDLIELSKDSRFIPGIYNYCDRWCERCEFTSRCSQFASQIAMEEGEIEPEDITDQKFWETLIQTLARTKEMLKDLAAEHGVALEPSEPEPAHDEQHERNRAVRKHPLTAAAEQYVFMSTEWFNNEAGSIIEALREDDASDDVRESVEIIRWYQMLPATKLFRALMTEELEGEPPPGSWLNDIDGSVKVALIALDRSILAWDRLRDLLPEKFEGISPIIAHLEQLRLQTEQAFPNARQFIRPGFDEAIEYLM